MIDLDKEFRTLSLLATVFIILGVALSVGGFGLSFLMNDPAMNEFKRKPSVADENTPVNRSKPRSIQEEKDRFSNSLSQTGAPVGFLGLLMLLIGVVLRYIIRDQTDDGGEAQANPELFREYAAQLVIAEKKRAKKNPPQQ